MPFHEQHFHDTFKLCKIFHGEKKNSCRKQAEEKSQHTMHTHLF